MLANATGYRPDSPVIEAAYAALDRARAAGGSGILSDQAQLILAARTGRPLREEWWRHMQERLRRHPVGPQDSGALGSLTDCQISGQCEFPVEEMLATFGAALSHGPHPIVLGVYANYALNELHDADLALRLWREAQSLSPQEREYTIALAKLLMREGQFDAAQREIDRLRHMGMAGQHARAADDLQARLAREKAAAR
jgi:tetratricopeptide (TPR) repeat protein